MSRSRLAARTSVLSIAILTFTALLSACGGDSDDDADPAETEETQDTSSATPAASVEAASPNDGDQPPDQPGSFAVGVTTVQYVKQSVSDGSERPLEVIVWYPTEATTPVEPLLAGVIDAPPSDQGPFPLLIFSHGNTGDPTESTFLTTHLATHGFVVAGVAHTGNTALDCRPCDAAAVTDSFRNRPADVAFVRDQLLGETANPAFDDLVDPEHVGIVGASFGGYTTVAGLAGGGFDAGAALAPFVELGGSVLSFPAGAESDIGQPVLIMAGRLDSSAPFPTAVSLYGRLTGSAEKFLVELVRGTHETFVGRPTDRSSEDDDLGPGHDLAVGHDLTNLYVTAFFRYYLNGEEEYLPYLLQGNEPSDAVVVVEASVTDDTSN